MRKTIFSLFALLSVTSLCFAQQTQTQVSKTAVSHKSSVTVATTKTLTAKVDTVTIGDPVKGTQSELAIVADDGTKSSFVVKSGTPVTDKEAKPVSLSDLKKDNKVAVEYVTQSGTKKAISIKLAE